MKNKRLQIEINKLVEQSFKGGKADELFIGKVSATLKKLNTSDALVTANLYLKGLKRKIIENTLVIESTIKLSSSELKSIQKMLKREVYAVEQKLNPSLLGGLRIKIGDEFADYSLQSKINQLKEKIRNKND